MLFIIHVAAVSCADTQVPETTLANQSLLKVEFCRDVQLEVVVIRIDRISPPKYNNSIPRPWKRENQQHLNFFRAQSIFNGKRSGDRRDDRSIPYWTFNFEQGDTFSQVDLPAVIDGIESLGSGNANREKARTKSGSRISMNPLGTYSKSSDRHGNRIILAGELGVPI